MNLPKVSFSHHLATALALIFGIAAGLTGAPLVATFSCEATALFMKLLQLLSGPMIFLAIVSTLTQIATPGALSSTVKKLCTYTLATTLLAAVIGLALFLFLHPVSPTSLPGTPALPAAVQTSYWDALKNMIPHNIIEPFRTNNVIALALIALALSLALRSLPQKTSQVTTAFFHALFEALLFLTSKLMVVIPLAIFAFTAQLTLQLKTEAASFTPFLWYAGCVLGANLLQGCVILPLFLKFKRHSPLFVARQMLPALIIAFISKSSTIALPLSLKCAVDRLKVSNQTARISFPLCSVINMNGCAAFILITTLFIATSYGMVFSGWELGLWVLLSTLAAIGNAGVPMGCFFLTSAFLLAIGLPLDRMTLILPLYAFFDMVETALNVWSDSCITYLVDRDLKQKKELTQDLQGA